MGLKGVLLTVTTIALMAVALITLPLTLAVLGVIALMVIYILADALGYRVLFKMALRNFTRRPATTAMVLAGLMVGTAIISASLVVGDTFDNMVVGETSKTFGSIDFVVTGAGDGSGRGLYSASNVSSVRTDVLGLEEAARAEWVLETTISIRSLASGLTQPRVGMLGMTASTAEGFGGFMDAGGKHITSIPAEGHAYITKRTADRLDIKDGSEIMLAKDQAHVITKVADVVLDEGLATLGPGIFVDIETAQWLSGNEGAVSHLIISMGPEGRDRVNTSREEVSSILSMYPGLDLKTTGDRAIAIEEGRSRISTLSSMFFVFGSFSIIAGIALIINIFTMLGEERKGEMGVARAVGMKRAHLRRLFTYEGLAYAMLAAAIGTVAGLALAYALIIAVGSMISAGGVNIGRYFAFTPLSLAAAYLAGFSLTLITIYLVTFRISKMNIVRAVRNIPEPLRARDDKGSFRIGLLMLASGTAVMVLGMTQESLALASGGLSLATLSAGLLLRRFSSDRVAWSFAGLATLFVWVPKGFAIFPYSGNIEMFVISGVFMVSSLLIVVIFNSDSIVRAFTAVMRAKGSYRAVIKTAISYPLRARMRTALSIFIFGLVIFTVTTLSMISGMLSVGIPHMVEETSGGFDIVAFSAAPVDMWGTINGAPGLVDARNVTSIIQLSQGSALVTMNRTDPRTGLTEQVSFRYMAVGIDDMGRFYTEGTYPLKEWDSSRFSSEREVWDAARNNASVVVLDGSAGEPAGGFGLSMGSSGFTGIKIGDDVQMTDVHGSNITMTVIGITEQSAFSGMFMSAENVRSRLGIAGTNLFLVKLADGADPDKQATLIQNQFWETGMSTISLRTMAQSAVSQIDGMFNLIKAFLALGLIIGITGLGIITIRSIRERTIEIGMMRAIGYTKRMVVVNFALESAFISVLGILIGSVLGVVVGYQLWESVFQDMGIGFLVPWWPVLTVGGMAFVATLLCVYPAARGASKVSPASVLRFE